jgi:PIN domain nuclease of toxin-antitoxin system
MLNLDTHIVVYFLEKKLLPNELELLASDSLGISSIVLWELAKLHQLGRIQVALSDSRFQALFKQLLIWPLDAEVALTSTGLDFRSDPADEIIAATSIVHAAPLVTRDRLLLRSKLVPLASE